MGNPHAVAFVDDLAHAGDLLVRPAVHPAVRLPGRRERRVRRRPRPAAMSRMRVHERGSGETRSCGTGACAVAVAAARRDGADPAVTGAPSTYTVDVPGGTPGDHRAARRRDRDDRPGRDRRRGRARPRAGWAAALADADLRTSGTAPRERLAEPSLEWVIRFTLSERRTAARGGLGSIKHRPGGHACTSHRRSTLPEVPMSAEATNPGRSTAAGAAARRRSCDDLRRLGRAALLGPAARDRLPDAIGHVAEGAPRPPPGRRPRHPAQGVRPRRVLAPRPDAQER